MSSMSILYHSNVTGRIIRFILISLNKIIMIVNENVLNIFLTYILRTKKNILSLFLKQFSLQILHILRKVVSII